MLDFLGPVKEFTKVEMNITFLATEMKIRWDLVVSSFRDGPLIRTRRGAGKKLKNSQVTLGKSS